MKFVAALLIFAAAFMALFEQSKSKPNVIIMVVAFVLFMFGMLRLFGKVQSKSNDESGEGDV